MSSPPMSSPPPTSAVAGGATSVASSSSAPTKICFNSFCKDPKSAAPRRKGWRLRSGEHAELCERCFFTYEQGTFCDAFHKDTGGWRNCESCGKRLHCGCIVSAPAYMLLDGGGIDCVACARKNLVMGPKPMWASPSLLPLQVPERPKELPVKGRNQVSGQFPGQWRHAANLWNVAGAQSELHQRLAYEFDRPTLADKMLTAGRSLISSSEKKIDDLPDRTAPGSTNHVTRDKYANGTIGQDSVPAFNTYAREEGKIGTLRDSGHLLGANDSNLTRNGLTVDPRLNTSGLTYESHPSSSVNLQRHLILKGDPKSLGTVASFSTQNDQNDPARPLITQPSGQTASPLARQSFTNSPNLVDPSGGELQAQMCNGRPRADPRARSQLLRYCPKTTDQELHQVSGERSNPQITHLFEKILSASDAGRIGRLVLPKKCAEAYFPKITHSEGLPLKVQDGTGNEWVFQFRFWPNNNSRMYVLEGVTACIQSMQLQAGDTVTFSRIDPEGKLVMGYRKASSISPEQENHTLQTGNVLETPLEANSKNIPAESFPALPLQPPKGNSEPTIPSNTADQGMMPKLEQPEFIQKNEFAVKSSEPPSKRKGNTVGPKSKRLRIDQDDSIQLKLTWAAAQDLLRPPPNGCPSIVIIDGHAFEEYKQEAPVIGMPTYIHTNQNGEKSQWTLCESCSKWRKLPVDALLPSGWTCSENLWDHKRSSCSVTQELTLEQLAEFLPIKSGTTKRSKVKVENDVAVSDGLDTLANLAIQGVGEEHTPSTKTTTKHPRHRAGCTCIVCIQPPSGKGPKHKEECACNVCLTVKRRFKTLKLKREKRDPDQDIQNLSTEMSALIQSCTTSTWKDNSPQKTIVNIDAVDEESEQRKPLPSPLKAQIDLNIQPEREEEPSPVASASGMSRAFPHVIN